MLVHARKNDDEVLFDYVEQGIGKARQDSAPPSARSYSSDLIAILATLTDGYRP